VEVIDDEEANKLEHAFRPQAKGQEAYDEIKKNVLNISSDVPYEESNSQVRPSHLH